MRFHPGPRRSKNEPIIEKRGINRRERPIIPLKKGLNRSISREGKVLIRIYDPLFLAPFIGVINNREEVRFQRESCVFRAIQLRLRV